MMKTVSEAIFAFVFVYLALDAYFGTGPIMAWLRWLAAAYHAGPPT